MWLQVVILGALIIDIVCKFIGVKECNDILERCRSCVRACGMIRSDVDLAQIDISRSVAKVDMIRDDCEDQLKASEAAVKGLCRDQHDIWEMVHSINAAVESLNKRLTNPRDLEPEWKPAADTDDIPFYDTEEDNYI